MNLKKQLEKWKLKKSFIVKCLIAKGVNSLRAQNICYSDRYSATSQEIDIVNEVAKDLFFELNLEFTPMVDIEEKILKKLTGN
jgi:hypothetical protein